MKSGILKKLCDSRRFVRFDRDIPNSHCMFGFVLAVSKDLIFLQNEKDFRLDGYSIIRRRDISKVRCGKHEKYFERILKEEGILNQVGFPETISLNNWLSVFHSLKRINQNIIVECEYPEVFDYVIGRIIRINNQHVKMQYFDSTGKWEREFLRVLYEDITIIRFGTAYVKVFSKYLRQIK